MAVLTQRRCGENPKPLYLIWSMGVIAQTCIQSCVMFSTNLILIYVNPSEIDEIIKELPCNKSPGLDGIIGEQFKDVVTPYTHISEASRYILYTIILTIDGICTLS